MATERDDLLTTTPAARIIGIRPDTVRSLVRRGRLDAIRTPSGQYLFRRRDCQREASRRQQAAVHDDAPAA